MRCRSNNGKDARQKSGRLSLQDVSQVGGGPLLVADCGSSVSFGGEEFISVFDSSDWANRGFCSKCGSHLFYRLKGNQHYVVPVGLFDEEPEVEFNHQFFIDEKPKYYAFANRTSDMTGAEVFARYAPKVE